jgi:hypothetical protein
LANASHIVHVAQFGEEALGLGLDVAVQAPPSGSVARLICLTASQEQMGLNCLTFAGNFKPN